MVLLFFVQTSELEPMPPLQQACRGKRHRGGEHPAPKGTPTAGLLPSKKGQKGGQAASPKLPLQQGGWERGREGREGEEGRNSGRNNTGPKDQDQDDRIHKVSLAHERL